MKILIVADLHGQKWILRKIDNFLAQNKVDAVFCLGDLCNGSDPERVSFARNFIDLVKKKYRIPLFLVHGNQEADDVKELFRQEGVSVHLSEKRLGKYMVIGVGFGEEFPTDPNFAAGKILLTHEPPRLAVVKKMRRRKNFAGAPLIHFAGHLHHIERAEKIGETLFVQCPTAQNSRLAVLTLPALKAEFAEF